MLQYISLAYSLALKKEATFSSETSGDFQRTTQNYMPEDKTSHVTVCFKNDLSPDACKLWEC
jgi:hypothetical protein